jgi:hypothetical protein
MSALDWLYASARPFVWHPARALMVGLALTLLAFAFRARGGRTLLIAAAGWVGFAILEFMAWRERADIRVDLLVTWPLLCILTLGCLLAWVPRLLKKSGGVSSHD